jgi:predicted nucleic acid-binding protein
MAKIILTDTCFWLGLVDPSDQHHDKSKVISNLINDYKILFPWPCLYETISTHLARSRQRTLYFESILNKPEIELIDDTKYKTTALSEVFEFNRYHGHTHSLADAVIREILKDIDIKVNYLVTYNAKDFYDVCAKRQIEILEE